MMMFPLSEVILLRCMRSILLRCIRSWESMKNAIVTKNLFKDGITIFTTIITLKLFYGGFKLFFHYKLQFNKCRINIEFIWNKKHPTKTRKTINKSNIITTTTQKMSGSGPTSQWSISRGAVDSLEESENDNCLDLPSWHDTKIDFLLSE